MSDLLDRRSRFARDIERDWACRNISFAAQPQLSTEDYRTATKEIGIPFLDGRYWLTMPYEDQIPPWLSDVIASLEDLHSLPVNWNSYGAPRIEESCIIGALQLLVNTMLNQTPVPAVVPTSRGTVLLEWHTKGIDLEIDVLNCHRFHVVAEDARRNEEFEEDLDTDLSLITDFIERLS